MNIGGGEAADQMVRMLLSGTEVVIRLPVRFLVQHTLEDLVGPIQFSHRQDHVDQLPPATPIPDGGEQQLLLSRPVLKFLVLLRGHGELPEISRLP